MELLYADGEEGGLAFLRNASIDREANKALAPCVYRVKR